MSKFRMLVLLVAALMLVAGPSSARSWGDGTDDCGDGDGGHELTWSPTSVWPPNHKYVDVTITYSDDDPDHQLMIVATSASHDEMLPDGSELNGGGNTTDDVVLPANGSSGTGSVSTTLSVRGERSGRGDGRVYTVNFTTKSMDENGQEDNDCSGSVTVGVPHDCRDGGCKP